MVGIYVRVSTLQQKDNYSVDTQRERGIAFANKVGESYAFYDEAASAKNIDGRAEFSRLLTDIEKGLINKVWVIEFSRLTRDIEDALSIRKTFVRYKCQVFVNDAPMDLSSPEAVLMYHIKSSVSEYERSNTIARVVRARHKQIDDGGQSFSHIFGYNYKYGEDGKKKWYVEEKEAEIVRHIFNLYGRGLSYQTITRALNASGFKTKKGRQFAITTIAKILAHPEYFGQTRNTKGEFVESKVYPAILDAEHYKALQVQHLNRRVKAIMFRCAKGEISGLIVCKHCGARYYTHRANKWEGGKNTGKLERYSHVRDTDDQKGCENKPKYIPKESIDRLIEYCYRLTLRNKAEIQKIVEKKEKEIFMAEDTLRKQVVLVEQKIKEIETKRQRLIAGISEGLYSVDDIRDNMKTLNIEKVEAENSIQNLKSQISLQQGEVDSMLTAFADRSIEEYENADNGKKRQIYQNVIKTIEIDNGWIRIIFVTDRKYECPITKIPEYIQALKNVISNPVFNKNRYRWQDLV